jgi:sterol desaturase/sphingolipid hydroxylase (fatty acid hydroxylase superfamily)
MSTTAVLAQRSRVVRAREQRLVLPTLAITVAAALLAWRGWAALRSDGVIRAIHAGQVELAGPVIIGFVTVVFLIERLTPAQRRPVLSRGHLLDLGYFLAHGIVVVPLIVLTGAGFSTGLAHLAPWLVIPRIDAVPRVVAVLAAVVAIDAVDWLAHLGNHKIEAFWRLHAVHHSQEELSILSTFRTHPLVHVSFAISAVPVLALAANAATPAAVLTAYSCLGALPHANVRWSYGRLGALVVSPAYHRRHHSPSERLDVNMGTVLTVWDRLSGRAVYSAGNQVAPTGLAGRPVPVEQAGPITSLGRTFVRQWIHPFTTRQEVTR